MKDSLVYEGQPDINFGLDEWLALGQTVGQRRRTVIEFDVSSIPSNATIIEAKLRLYYATFGGADPVGRTKDAHRITELWLENVVTWTNQPDHYVDVEGSFVVPASFGWIEFSIKDLVQEWVNETYVNHGLKLKDRTEDISPIAVSYYRSKDVLPNRPELYINYAIILYYVTGVTRDADGNPLGGCTVWLFRTSDKKFIEEKISDGNGVYYFLVGDTTTEFFIRAYKDDTPNVFGTTDRDLVGVEL